MLTAGDERGRSQDGNNNAYAQDNEISWVSWERQAWREDLLATTRYLLKLRRDHPALRASEFFLGTPRPTATADEAPPRRPDLDWRTADGHHLDHHQWHDAAIRALQMVRLAADGSSVLVVVNGSLDPAGVRLTDGPDGPWELAWDSVWEHPDELAAAAIRTGLHPRPGDTVVLEGLSLRVYTAR
jgi:isoamylase